jgi:hypothetical protein
LGVLINGYLTGEPAYSLLTPDIAALRNQMADLRSMFCYQGLGLCPAIPAYIHLIKQCVLARVLAHSAVLRGDLGLADSTINRSLRWSMGVPPTYASVLLRSELNLLPLNLLGRRRALRQLGRFLRHSVFFKTYIRPLMLANAHSELSLLFDNGPLEYYNELLTEHSPTMCPPAELFQTLSQYPLLSPRYVFWLHAAQLSASDWLDRVESIITAQFTSWQEQELLLYPAHQRPLLRKALGPDRRRSRARYLALGGPIAHIGLRFKGLSQRAGHPMTAQFSCVYCSCPAGENGAHWIQCPGLPLRSRQALFDARASIAQESGWPAHQEYRIDTAYLQVSWPRQTPVATRAVLWSMSVILDDYRRALPQSALSEFYPSRIGVVDA